jgi:hypothetical protein
VIQGAKNARNEQISNSTNIVENFRTLSSVNDGTNRKPVGQRRGK